MGNATSGGGQDGALVLSNEDQAAIKEIMRVVKEMLAELKRYTAEMRAMNEAHIAEMGTMHEEYMAEMRAMDEAHYTEVRVIHEEHRAWVAALPRRAPVEMDEQVQERRLEDNSGAVPGVRARLARSVERVASPAA